jgi:hypothetical protein
MKHIKVESCGSCPLRRFTKEEHMEYNNYCAHGETFGMELFNIKIIHPECPLESLPEWISVKDRLPDRVNVLAAYRFGVGEAKFINGKFFTISSIYSEYPGVTHWQPLPSPPKEDD